METRELIQAAAAIAGPLAARSSNISPELIQEIARTAVAIAREIETEARERRPPSGTGSRPSYETKP
jgi:hypothetical protein